MKKAKTKAKARIKGNKKAKGKNAAKKKGSDKDKSEVKLEEVRKEITEMVSGAAAKMAKAVIGVGKTGQLAPVKYMFEVSGLYPASEAAAGKPEEDTLAKTLLDALHLPTEPVDLGEDDEKEKPMLPKEKDSPDETEESEHEEARKNEAEVKRRRRRKPFP